ncbi:predicted protein [Thalassiosira pseudonana CCMP1335]|uniref:Uncharacterized protein n=1 Tax=Thalassiosira pseudonana TaxID=35128 RepID=B8CDL1_THAPS|nr:predicted protein [Thalassiosira pseudonana CCMP1335]EED88472.1 predicted protein [Thalassiosira pseudonana CCMP1335]|eukprot:g13284.t1 g13284   contig8:316899-317655(-)
MKTTACLLSLLATTAAFAPAPTSRTTTSISESKADLESLATKLNPTIRFYDPLNPNQSRRSMLTTTAAAAALLLTQQSSPASALETYLTEPTEEFKESERQRMEFRKKQLLLKGGFVKVLARLTSESNTEEELVRDLSELKELVIQTGGLPLGIKKEDMYKVIRGKKAKGNWPTNVEIAYQKLKSEIAYQQSPNTEKDLENPL